MRTTHRGYVEEAGDFARLCALLVGLAIAENGDAGLARAAIVACLDHLRDLGIRHAYLTGYSETAIGLYGSLGAEEELRCATGCGGRRRAHPA